MHTHIHTHTNTHIYIYTHTQLFPTVPTFGETSANTQGVYVQGSTWSLEPKVSSQQGKRKAWVTVAPKPGNSPRMTSGRWFVFLPEQENCSKHKDPYLTRHWLNVLLAPGMNLMLHPNPLFMENLKRFLSVGKVLYAEKLGYRFLFSCLEWKCLADLCHNYISNSLGGNIDFPYHRGLLPSREF